MALVIRRVDDPVSAHGGHHMMQLLVLALDFAQNWIQRMLQRPVNRIALRRPQLVQIRVNPLASPVAPLAVPAPEVLDDLGPREDRLGDVIEHGPAQYITRWRGRWRRRTARSTPRLPGRGCESCLPRARR